jgi:hypothetical protein
MNDNELSSIFGKTAIWDFYINNEYKESLRFNEPNNFMTCNGHVYSISNIKICLESGVLTFEKRAPGSKMLKASLVFIKDKSMLVGFEGTKQVKYIKTSKKSFT